MVLVEPLLEDLEAVSMYESRTYVVDNSEETECLFIFDFMLIFSILYLHSRFSLVDQKQHRRWSCRSWM